MPPDACRPLRLPGAALGAMGAAGQTRQTQSLPQLPAALGAAPMLPTAARGRHKHALGLGL